GTSARLLAMCASASCVRIKRRQADAIAAINQATTIVERFVAEHFEVGQSDVPELPGTLTQPIAYRLRRVVALDFHSLDDVKPGQPVKASGDRRTEGNRNRRVDRSPRV